MTSVDPYEVATRATDAELAEHYRDRAEGLSADLDITVEKLWEVGGAEGREWVGWNYAKVAERLRGEVEAAPASAPPVAVPDAVRVQATPNGIVPRREVLAFAVLMEIELRANDHKGGWKADMPALLSNRVEQEAAELKRAAFMYQTGAPGRFSERDRANVANEAADVANMAMMVADVCQALPHGSFRTLGFDLAAFSIENRIRCEAAGGFNHPLDMWTLSDWMVATAGEIGEAANVVKKLNRYRDGITGNDRSEAELRQDLADELADAFIYLDLTAQAAGIDLPKAIRDKFDRTSAKIGYVEELPF